MTTDLHHLAAAYALDALDADERRSFEQHYPTCDVCNAEVHEYRETAARLGAATATMPSAGLRDRVMDEIARTRQIAPIVPDRVVDLAEHRRRRTNLSWGSALVGAAAAVVIAFIGAIVVFRGGTADVSDADLVALLAAPDAAVEPLSGSGDGAISVVWSAERDAVAVIGAELSDPGDERTYAGPRQPLNGIRAHCAQSCHQNVTLLQFCHCCLNQQLEWRFQ